MVADKHYAPAPFAVRHFDKIVGANLTRIS